MNIIEEELDVIQISQKIFSNSPKKPFTYQLVFDSDLKICYESLLTMFTYGMKMLYGNSQGKVNLNELQEKWHLSSLERIFIENRIYHKIEELDNWQKIITVIHTELEPYTKYLLRKVTDKDVERLTEIKIKNVLNIDLNNESL